LRVTQEAEREKAAVEVPEEWLQGIETGWLESKSSRAGTADKAMGGGNRELPPAKRTVKVLQGGKSSAIHGRYNGAGRTGMRHNGSPDIHVEERSFCGPWVWPEMKMFAVACWCRLFSSGMVDREPETVDDAVGSPSLPPASEALRSLGCEFVPLIVERQGALSMSVTKFIKNVCGVARSRRKHGKGFFVHCWTAVLANAVLSNTRIRIQDGQMSSASAEGRLLV
jgi:hypothetical protein